MTDRELLELAAKAAGIALEFRVLIWSDGTEYPCYEDKDSVSEAANCVPVIRWNPLTDDGDALRLAVKLGMVINCKGCVIDGFKFAQASTSSSNYAEEEDDGDVYKTTRRAIVRAAAEIGKEMP